MRRRSRYVCSRMTIREIDATSADEVVLVAARMRQTLVELLGEQRGTELYSMDWLVQRVRWHVDPEQTVAKVFLVERPDGWITAHAITRIEHDEQGKPYGYFSTVFVEPGSRREGVASALVRHVESWLRSVGMLTVSYNTAADHENVIRLFERHGYRITHRTAEMVQLSKSLDAHA